jgi:LPS export ABC transporter protein LptC/lipopolysaccharide transport protein LptA
MSRAPSSRHIVLLRRFLLVAAVLLLAGLGGLFWLGRARTEPEEEAPSADEQPLAAGATTYEARGFDHTVSIGDRPIFRIQAAKTRTTGEGEVPKLQDVELTYYRESGAEYTITSQYGEYDLKTQAAKLQGQVMVHAPDDLTLRTEGLELSPHADWLVSSAAVQLSLGDTMRGTAHGLRANLKRSTYILEKEVLLSGTSKSGEALALRCDRLSYDRPDRLIRAVGHVLLRYGDSLIDAGRLGAFFDDEERNLRFVNARWGVKGEVHDSAGGGKAGGVPTRFAGDELLAELLPDGKKLKSLQLNGGEGSQAWIVQTGVDGTVRRIQSTRIRGDFMAGRLHRLTTPEKGDLTETSGPDDARVTRTSTAGRMTVDFTAAGAPTTAEFHRGVELSDGQHDVKGQDGAYDASKDTFTVTGDPATATEEGRVTTAPRFDYELSSGMVRGEGGVRIRFNPGGGVSLPGADASDARKPVQVEGATIDADSGAGTFRLEGNVRAWQGENYLLANTLSGDNTGETLVAEGKVKTVWKQQENRASNGESSKVRTIEASGSRLEYARSVRHMTYFGPASVRQGRRRMRCDRIDAQLDEAERVRHMTCVGTVDITDPETGRRATGERADYDVGTDVIHLTGSPVILHQQDGSEIEGALLIYHLDDGTATIQSVAPGAPEEATTPPETTPEDGAPPADDDAEPPAGERPQ